MSVMPYEGMQYECNKLGYENTEGGYWVWLLGDSVRIETSATSMPVWNEHFNRDERRDEVDALVAWRMLCRSLIKTKRSLRNLIDMHCRIPYGKPPIADSEWSEENTEYDENRLALHEGKIS